MAFFKKLGSFVDSLFGQDAPPSGPFVKPQHKTMPKYGQPKLPKTAVQTSTDLDAALAEYKTAVAAAVASARQELASKNRPIVGQQGENLYDVWRTELASEASDRIRQTEEWMERQRREMDPLTRFLYGEMVDVVSSNVQSIQYDREHQWLYIIFRSGAWYRYGEISPQEAESLFFAGSKGKWCWDVLRIRGTVFGFKKPYQFMEYNLGGYQPKYMQNSTWEAEHAAIPATGDIPESWLKDNSPYSLGWLVSRNPRLFPHAKILSEGTEDVGTFGDAMSNKK